MIGVDVSRAVETILRTSTEPNSMHTQLRTPPATRYSSILIHSAIGPRKGVTNDYPNREHWLVTYRNDMRSVGCIDDI